MCGNWKTLFLLFIVSQKVLASVSRVFICSFIDFQLSLHIVMDLTRSLAGVLSLHSEFCWHVQSEENRPGHSIYRSGFRKAKRESNNSAGRVWGNSHLGLTASMKERVWEGLKWGPCKVKLVAYLERFILIM